MRLVRHAVLAVIAARSDREQHPASVRREDDVARPMVPDRNVAHDGLGFARRLRVAGAIGKAQHLTLGRDIDETRCRPGRIEGDAIGTIGEIGGENSGRRAGVRGAKDAQARGTALGEEDVAIGRHPHLSRRVEAGNERRDGEARRQPQPRSGGARHQVRAIRRRMGDIGRGHVGWPDQPHHSRRRCAPVAIGLRAGEAENSGSAAAPKPRRGSPLPRSPIPL